MIILTIAAFACTGLLIIWAMAKSASMRDEEEQRQRKAEALVKGGSIFKPQKIKTYERTRTQRVRNRPT